MDDLSFFITNELDKEIKKLNDKSVTDAVEKLKKTALSENDLSNLYESLWDNLQEQSRKQEVRETMSKIPIEERNTIIDNLVKEFFGTSIANNVYEKVIGILTMHFLSRINRVLIDKGVDLEETNFNLISYIKDFA